MSNEFENVELDIDDDTKGGLVARFISTRLDPASQCGFKESVESGEYIEVALFNAIINEMVLEALHHQHTQLENIEIGDVDGY